MSPKTMTSADLRQFIAAHHIDATILHLNAHTSTVSDAARELVERGREQARQQAKLLKHAGLWPEIVLTSPLVRARQTAHEFCESAGIPGGVSDHVARAVA